MPTGVIGIDVDAYLKKDQIKPGDVSLAELFTQLGPLPPTWSSTARGPGLSRIYFYRVPEDVRLSGILGPGIEAIQRHHRYAVAWPSTHPETGQQYRWYAPDGTPSARIPRPSELPELPAKWVAAKTVESGSNRAPATSADTAAAYSAITQAQGDMCPEMSYMKRKSLEMMQHAAAVGEARHDTMLGLSFEVCNLALEGHAGYAEMQDYLQGVWSHFVSDYEPSRKQEFWTMMHGGLARAVGKHGMAPQSVDPCASRDLALLADQAQRISAEHTAQLELASAAADGAGPGTPGNTAMAFVPPPDMVLFDTAGINKNDNIQFSRRFMATYSNRLYWVESTGWMGLMPKHAQGDWSDQAWRLWESDAAMVTAFYEYITEPPRGSESVPDEQRRWWRTHIANEAGATKVARGIKAHREDSSCQIRRTINDVDGASKIDNQGNLVHTLWAGGQCWDLGASVDGPVIARHVSPFEPRLTELDYAPDPTVPTPLFDRYVETVLFDPEIREYAMLLMGAVLSGQAPKIIIWAHGKADTGKTRFLSMMKDVFGAYGTMLGDQLFSPQSGHRTYLMELRGRRMGFLDEAPSTARTVIETLKALSGGGDITANPMHKDPITFKASHVLCFSSNDAPPLREEAVRARLRPIPFGHSGAAHETPEFLQSVRDATAPMGANFDAPAWIAERPGVLAKVMHYSALWLANRDLDRGSIDLQARYLREADEQNLLAQWASEELVPQGETAARPLFKAFLAYCYDMGERNPRYTPGRFKDELSQLGMQYTVKRNVVTWHCSLRSVLTPATFFPGPNGGDDNPPSGGGGGTPPVSPTAPQGPAGGAAMPVPAAAPSPALESLESPQGILTGILTPETPSQGPVVGALLESTDSFPSIKEENQEKVYVSIEEDTYIKSSEERGEDYFPKESHDSHTAPTAPPKVERTFDKVQRRRAEAAAAKAATPEPAAAEPAAEEPAPTPAAEEPAPTPAPKARTRKRTEPAPTPEPESSLPLVVTKPLAPAISNELQVLPIPASQVETEIKTILARTGGTLVLDVEHTGYPVGHDNFRLKTIQLGDDQTCVVLDPEDEFQVSCAVDAMDAATEIVAHQAQADVIPVAVVAGIDPETRGWWHKVTDTFVLAALSPPEKIGYQLGLKELVDKFVPDATAPAADKARRSMFTSNHWIQQVDATTPVERSGWAQVDPTSGAMARYAASDVLDTGGLLKVFRSSEESAPHPRSWLPPMGETNGSLDILMERERAFQRICARLTHRGLKLDLEQINKLIESHEQSSSADHTTLLAAGIENPDAPAQVGAALEGLGARLPRTKTGKISTTKEQLERLTWQESDAGELAKVLLRYRKDTKLLNAFLRQMESQCVRGDGRVRPTILTLGAAATGRTSSVRPNAQQMPREGGVRECFTADEGWLLCAADFSSVEVRVAAWLSQDFYLAEMIRNGLDLHSLIAERVWGSGYTKAQRYAAKRLVFGKLYGAGIATLTAQLGAYGDKVHAVIEAMQQLTPTLTNWSEGLQRHARSGQHNIDRGQWWFHADPRYPRGERVSPRVTYLPGRTPHVSVNYAIQSVARELLVDALLDFDSRAPGLTVLPVHDELVVHAPAELAPTVTAILADCMTINLPMSDGSTLPVVCDPDEPSFAWQSAA